MGVLVLMFFISVVTGYCLARYQFEVNEWLALPPLSLGIGSVIHLFLLNMLLRAGTGPIIIWGVPILMVLLSSALWWFKRQHVLPLRLNLSGRSALFLFIGWIVLGAFFLNERLVHGGVDEFGHAPFSAMLLRVGLPGITVPSYADPRYCSFYHYGVDVVIGALFAQSGIEMAVVTIIYTAYNMFSAIGLGFVLLWFLMRRRTIVWPAVGAVLFTLVGSGQWLLLAYYIPGLREILSPSVFGRVLAWGPAFDPTILTDPSRGSVLFRSPPDLMVSLSSYMNSPNPPAFAVGALLALIGWQGLRRSQKWYWYPSVGLLVAYTALIFETATPLIALPIGLDLVWHIWQARRQPLTATRNTLLYAVPALVAIALQGGLITDTLFCKISWKEMYSEPSTFTGGASNTEFLLKDELGYQSIWLPEVRATLTNPAEWFSVIFDWGFSLPLYPIVMVFLVLRRHRNAGLIMLCGLPSLLLPFVTTNAGDPTNTYRFAVIPLWLGSMLSIFLFRDLYSVRSGWIRPLTTGLVIFLGVGLVLTDIGNAIATLGRPPNAPSFIFEPLDYEVSREWFGKLDVRQDAVFDPSEQYFMAKGPARSISLFGTYGRYSVNTSFFVNVVGRMPGVDQWWATGSPATLLGGGYNYLYIDNSTWGQLSESQRKEITKPNNYELLQTWRDSSGGFRRLYRIPYETIQYRLGDALLVTGLIMPAEMQSPDKLSVGVKLEAASNIPEDYTIFFHLIGPDGKLVAQDDSPRLGGGWTTSSMIPGFRSGRSAVLDIPVMLQPGSYILMFGAYRNPSIERLPAYDSSGQLLKDNLIVLGIIEVR